MAIFIADVGATSYDEEGEKKASVLSDIVKRSTV